MKSIKDRRQTIFYYTYGNYCNPAIVLLHAAFSCSQSFGHQVEALSKSYYVIAIDLVGHGQSRLTDYRVGIEASAQHIVQIMEQEKIARAHFVGVSVGGLLIQYFATLNPSRVASLTVVGAFDIGTKSRLLAKKHHRYKLYALLLKMTLSKRLFLHEIAALTTITEQGQQQVNDTLQFCNRRSMFPLRSLSKLYAVAPPTPYPYPLLAIYGERDQRLDAQVKEEWKKSHPEMELVTLSDAGHFAFMDHPERFNRLLLDFLQQHPLL